MIPLSWSPDSRFLAVLRCESPPLEEDDELALPGPMAGTLCVLDIVAGVQVFQLASAFSCSWSSEGGRLLLAVYESGGPVSLMTTHVQRWTEPVEIGTEVSLSGGYVADALWSSEGKQVAFVAGRRRHCYVTGLQTALPFEDVTCVAWRPRTDQLALLVGHEVILVRPSAPEESTVALRIPSRQYYDVVGMAWSPDGRMMAVEAHSAEQND